MTAGTRQAFDQMLESADGWNCCGRFAVHLRSTNYLIDGSDGSSIWEGFPVGCVQLRDATLEKRGVVIRLKSLDRHSS